MTNWWKVQWEIIAVYIQQIMELSNTRIVLVGLSLQPGHYSSLKAPNLQPTANQERHDQCGNQHHSHELLMMGIVVPETCWGYKKHNEITSGI